MSTTEIIGSFLEENPEFSRIEYEDGDLTAYFHDCIEPCGVREFIPGSETRNRLERLINDLSYEESITHYRLELHGEKLHGVWYFHSIPTDWTFVDSIELRSVIYDLDCYIPDLGEQDYVIVDYPNGYRLMLEVIRFVN